MLKVAILETSEKFKTLSLKELFWEKLKVDFVIRYIFLPVAIFKNSLGRQLMLITATC